MTEKIYKTAQVAGTLFIPGMGEDNSYHLLSPHPIRKADDWMTDDMAMFYVVHYHGLPHHIVVKGPFVIDYWNAGNTIEIEDAQEADFELDNVELENLFLVKSN